MKAVVRATIEDQISDHRNVEIEFKYAVKNKSNEQKLIRVWKNYSRCSWLSEIANWIKEWDIIQKFSCEVKTNWLLNNLKNSASKFIETKIVKVSKEFFDFELEDMRQHKNQLYKQAQYMVNCQAKWDEYKQYKNEYKAIIKQKKYDFMQKQLNKVDGDSKGTWRLLNSLITDKDVENNYDTIVANNIVLTDKKAIANKFNKYFIDTIKEINEEIPTVEQSFSDNQSQTVDINFEFIKISIDQLNQYLRNMKKKDSKDSFDISVNLLLDSMPLLDSILADIINDSFESPHFPEILRQSVIVPIRKVLGTSKMEEFRPINTLPCVEKLIEKIACDQLNKYIDDADILCDEQSGFRSSHSCESALNYVISEWKEAQERGETVLAVFLDFQRAFETIDRELLLKKLYSYGVGSNALKWFKSFLTGHRLCE